ncbi:LodA/GoxA family CTQ-dependent oxidase [Kitasatospora sp. NPDC053057]|uniref:LodA/GoxA family CTQ-dependent oxidase n=1 Tax=Kitasatospora sp. NPDC053057 TaxID=3364062 RepID=UPI0037CBA32A
MTDIAYVKIHPAIGIARVGNGDTFFYGPETPDEPPHPPGFSKEGTGKIKRQAARFRVYGYDKEGNVVREILDGQGGAGVEWTVHLANRKAAWYKFSLALDIPEAQRLSQDQYERRNNALARDVLTIDPGPRTISGANQSGRSFDTGKINNIPVYLGELRTDDSGRLVVLGGKGSSASFTSPPSPLTTFGNNEGWYDDISDGPVTAKVTIGGTPVEVKPAWVVVAPPNYAPDVKGIVTLHDLLYDLFVQSGDLPAPTTVVFDEHIKPLLQRFNGHQWVNQGFAAEYGWNGPNDFTSPGLLAILGSKKDQYRDLRQRVYYQMRSYDRDGLSPLPWPWLYGDAMAVPAKSPRQYGVLTTTQEAMLAQWVDGNFDDKTKHTVYQSLDAAPVELRPALLDRAALDYCLADAFHPGCEVTWPIRHDTLYAEPFRISHRPDSDPEPDYGQYLLPGRALSANGPLHAQIPGGLTRWMGLPWQTDTASCRSGYELRANIGPRYSPYLPSFWPARVPNHVLKKTDFDIVNQAPNGTVTEDKREEAFVKRAVWLRFLSPDKLTGLKQMVENWSKFGVVETNPYTVDDKFPKAILVESTPDPSLGKVDDRQNLVNIHVREAGHPQLDEARRATVNQHAADEVARTSVFRPEEISAGYLAKVDPFRDTR